MNSIHKYANLTEVKLTDMLKFMFIELKKFMFIEEISQNIEKLRMLVTRNDSSIFRRVTPIKI